MRGPSLARGVSSGLPPVAEGLWRLPIDQAVMWTGEAHRGPGTSRIAQYVAAMQAEDPWTPMPLRLLFQRVVEGGMPVTPDHFKSALRVHQRARPAVLILVRPSFDGGCRAVYDIPMGLGLEGFVAAGEELRFGGGDASDRSAGGGDQADDQAVGIAPQRG